LPLQTAKEELMTGAMKLVRRVAVMAAIGVSPAGAQAPPPVLADAIYYNGVVVTMDDAAPEAKAVALAGTKILAVGPDDAVMKYRGPATKVTDLKGKTVVPGFIDAHSHLAAYGYFNDPANWVDVSSVNMFFKPLPGSPGCPAPGNYQTCFIPVRSQDDVIDRLKTAIVNAKASNAKAVLAFNYDPSRLGPSKGCTGAGFTCQNFENGTARETLDQLSKDIPIFIESESGHVAYVNTPALEQLKICGAYDGPPSECKYTPVINTDVEQKLARLGQLDEDLTFYATGHFQGQIFEKSGKNLLGAFEGVRRAAKIYASRGFTLTQEGAASAGLIDIYDVVTREPDFPTTAAMVAYDYQTNDFQKTIDIANGAKPKIAGNPRLFVAAVKSFADGSPQAYTAFLGVPGYFQLFAPFTSTAIFPSQPYAGLPDLRFPEMTSRLVAAHKAGYPMIIHQNGSEAIAQATGAIAEAQRLFPSPDLRDTVLHAPLISPNQIGAMKGLKNVTISFLMDNLHYWGQPLCQQVLGPELAQRVYPASTAVQSGARLTMHHDSPVTPPDPLFAMWVAKKRQSQDMPWYPDAPKTCPARFEPGLGISIKHGLKAYTIDAAWQYGLDDSLGSVTAGKTADLAILSDNPLKYEDNPDGLLKITVLATISQGRYFDHAAAPAAPRGTAPE
jgi:predicted amidohydrolase YtcJ